jgi:hypothetical protein
MASTRSAWDGEADGGGSCGRDAAERALGAAARLGCSGGGPARLLRRRGRTGSKQTTQDGSLPACTAPGVLLDGEVATTVRNGDGAG